MKFDSLVPSVVTVLHANLANACKFMQMQRDAHWDRNSAKTCSVDGGCFASSVDASIVWKWQV